MEGQHRAEGARDESNECKQHKIPRSGTPSWGLWTDSEDVFEVSIAILGFSIIKTIWYGNCIQILHVNLLSIFVSVYTYPLGDECLIACLIQLICMDLNEKASVSLGNDVHTLCGIFFTTKETNTHLAIGFHSSLFRCVEVNQQKALWML